MPDGNTAPPWRSWLQFLAGLILVGLVGVAAIRLRPKPATPDGWLSIQPPNDVFSLAEYKGELWAGGKENLYRIDLREGALLRIISGQIGFDFVRALLVDNQGIGIWVGHLQGLSLYDGQTWTHYDTSHGLVQNEVLALAQTKTGGLYIGTEGGLSYFENGTWHTTSVESGLADPSVSVLYLDTEERLWVGYGINYGDGLSVLEEGRWRTYRVEDGLAHNKVNAILQTPDGRMWFGTGFSAYGGLSIWEGAARQTLTQSDGLAGGKVRFLFQDQAGAVWIGSEYGGIVRKIEADFQHFSPENGLAGWEVKAMVQDSIGNLWLGTELGLTRISAATWRALGHPEDN